MFNLGEHSKGKYHRFQYHPRNYDEQKESLNKRKESLKAKLENKGFEEDEFDVLEEFNKRYRKKNKTRFDLIFIGYLFILHLIFFREITSFFETKYKFAESCAYFSLVLLGFIFIKRSKNSNA